MFFAVGAIFYCTTSYWSELLCILNTPY